MAKKNKEIPTPTSSAPVALKQKGITQKVFTDAQVEEYTEIFNEYLVTLGGCDPSANMPFLSLVLFRMERKFDKKLPTACVSFNLKTDKYTLILGAMVLQAIEDRNFDVIKGLLFHEIMHWSSKHFSPDAQKFIRDEVIKDFKKAGLSDSFKLEGKEDLDGKLISSTKGQMRDFDKKIKIFEAAQRRSNIAMDICNNELVLTRFKNAKKQDYKDIILKTMIATTPKDQEKLDELAADRKSFPGLYDVSWVHEFLDPKAKKDAPWKYYYELIKEDDDKNAEDEPDDQDGDGDDDEEVSFGKDPGDGEGQGRAKPGKGMPGQPGGESGEGGDEEGEGEGQGGEGQGDQEGEGDGDNSVQGNSRPDDGTFHINQDMSELMDDDSKDAMDEKVRNGIRAALEEHQDQARQGKTAGMTAGELAVLEIPRKEIIKEKLDIRARIANAIKGTSIVKRQTRLRKSRRIKGSYFSPKRKTFSTTIGICIDVSGSQYGNIHDVLNVTLDLAMKYKYTVDVWLVDTQIQDFIPEVTKDSLRDNKILNRVVSYTGGGTDLTVCQRAMNKRYENSGDNIVAVYITDGYTNFLDHSQGWTRPTIQIMEKNDVKLPNCRQYVEFESSNNSAK